MYSLLDEYNQTVSMELQTKLKIEFLDQYPEKTIKSNLVISVEFI